jgi:hypothetical protein
MTRPAQRRGGQRRPNRTPKPQAVDIWRTPGEIPEVERITVPHDVTALVRSLGEPPMHGGSGAGLAFGTVVERAAATAAALALSADLLVVTEG